MRSRRKAIRGPSGDHRYWLMEPWASLVPAGAVGIHDPEIAAGHAEQQLLPIGRPYREEIAARNPDSAG